MKYGKLAAILIVMAVMAGCGGNNSSTAITISPTSTVVVLNGTQQFTATIAGNSNTNVNWFVSFQNGSLISGGNSTLGTISTTGLYTAPGTLTDPPTVSIVAQAAAATSVTATATVTLDSGIRVVISPLNPTMGTGETLPFTATVTGTSNTAVTWQVNGVDGGSAGTGTITPSGVFTAPSTPQTVTVAAVSVADINQSAGTMVTVDTAADPTLLSIDPTITGQGSVQQSVYLTGTNFYTTSVVLANGTPVLPTTLVSTATTSSVLTVTLPANLLQTAGSIALTVQRQNGDQSAPLSLTVSPVRPAIVSASPNSASQGGNAVTVNLDGGYYSVSTPNGPHTQAEFNGVPHGISSTNSRQAQVPLSATDIATAGLFSMVVQNTGVPAGSPAYSGVNVAVQPVAASIPLTPIATVPVGSQPASVAVDTATGIAVVANKGTLPGTLSLINLATNTVSGTVQVGNGPTSVAVDNLLNEAAVVNNTDNTVSVVSLSTQAVIYTFQNLPITTTAYSIGINPLTHRGLVANSASNAATVIDLSTTPPSVICVVGGSNPQMACSPGANVPPVSTGPQPSIAIEPRLNWAVVSPGGSGAITIVDLGLPATTVPSFAGRTPQVIATLGLQGTPQGIAVNPQTDQSLITDPNNNFFTEFSLLDQTTNLLTLDKGEIADAINPLTNMAVSVNTLSNQAAVINMQTLQPILPQGQGIQTGTTPVSVDVDPVTNEAVVANSGNNTASILSLGAIRPLHVIQSSPATTYTSSSPLTLTIVGGGFDTTSVVRLDQTNLLPTTVMPAGCTSSCRELVATVPATLLALPRRFILDVLQDTSLVSNVTDLTVMASVTVGTAPGAVAIDSDSGTAVVTNTVDGTINTIDLTTGLASPAITVGSDPEGVAILPQSSEAVVTNFGSNNVSIVDLLQGIVTATVTTGDGPLGVSINPDTTTAVVANNTSNTLSLIDVATAQVTGTISTDMYPLAAAVDPALNYAAVTATGGIGTGTVVLYNLANNSTVGRISGLQVPSGIVFDPVGSMFVVANSLQNNLVLIDPVTLLTNSVRTGINPYSLDYNFQTSTLVTANSLSGTLSVMAYLEQSGIVQQASVQDVLPIGNSSMFSVAIDPLTNMAVVADQANNRVLLVPLPH